MLSKHFDKPNEIDAICNATWKEYNTVIPKSSISICYTDIHGCVIAIHRWVLHMGIHEVCSEFCPYHKSYYHNSRVFIRLKYHHVMKSHVTCKELSKQADLTVFNNVIGDIDGYSVKVRSWWTRVDHWYEFLDKWSNTQNGYFWRN